MAVEIIIDATEHVPNTENIIRWADAALTEVTSAEVCIRVIDETEMTRLNGLFRGKHQPTNVLSFPAEVPKEVAPELLGDIAICASVVIAEAKQQQKSLDAHWAHMVIHGCLHLQGYDHVTDVDADNMERLETQLLHSFGYADPYTVNQAL